MAAAPGIPQNFNVQSANQVILVSWALVAGATSYDVQRSLDSVTFTSVATVSGSPLATSYLDSAVTLSTQYWYKVAAINATGISAYTQAQSAVPTPSGEMCLSQIRLAAMQRADRVNSNFVTMPEWRNYINQAMFELYDLLITVYEDLYVATPVAFTVTNNQFLYDMPNGSNTFMNALTNQTFVPRPYYKLLGVDLALQTANNAYVTINKFQFADRNRFVYPNTASTIYGVFNMQYRLLGSQIEFIPTPSMGQQIRLWYIPRLTELLQDTDTTDTGISGWIEYVIVKAAYLALTKEESDTTSLVMQLAALQKRIEESAANRDAGLPDRISDSRSNNGSGYGGSQGWNGGTAGWAMLALPRFAQHDVANVLSANSVFSNQSCLGYVALGIALAYFCCLYRRQLGLSVPASSYASISARSLTSFAYHVIHIILVRTKKQMARVNTTGVVAGVADVKPSWNKTNKQLISDSSRSTPLTVSPKPGAREVWFTPTASSPLPTALSLYNTVKKTLFKSLFHNISVSQQSSKVKP